LKKEGISVFYAGLLPCLVGSGGIVAIEFGVSEYLERKFKNVSHFKVRLKLNRYFKSLAY